MSGVTNPALRLLFCLLACELCTSVQALSSGQPAPPEHFPLPFSQHSQLEESYHYLSTEEDVAQTGRNDGQRNDTDAPPPPSPRKKRKKPSPLDRLRQLYFLPLLHPLGGKH